MADRNERADGSRCLGNDDLKTALLHLTSTARGGRFGKLRQASASRRATERATPRRLRSRHEEASRAWQSPTGGQTGTAIPNALVQFLSRDIVAFGAWVERGLERSPWWSHDDGVCVRLATQVFVEVAPGGLARAPYWRTARLFYASVSPREGAPQVFEIGLEALGISFTGVGAR